MDKDQEKELYPLAQELGQSIHDIMAKHMIGKPFEFQNILEVTISALTPNLGDLISFMPTQENKSECLSIIRQYFGRNLAGSIQDYLDK